MDEEDGPLKTGGCGEALYCGFLVPHSIYYSDLTVQVTPRMQNEMNPNRFPRHIGALHLDHQIVIFNYSRQKVVYLCEVLELERGHC